MKNTLVIIALSTLVFTACKKKEVIAPAPVVPVITTTSSAAPVNNTEYYISYTDGGSVIKFKTSGNVCSAWTPVLNNEEASYLQGPTNNESGWLRIVFPTDSSNMSKVILNQKYKTEKEESHFDYGNLYSPSGDMYMLDSTIGSLTYTMTFNNGTDVSLNYYDKTKYYNIIKSISYLKSEYDVCETRKKVYYVVTGEFTIVVKNDASNTTRDLTNGTYKIVVETTNK